MNTLHGVYLQLVAFGWVGDKANIDQQRYHHIHITVSLLLLASVSKLYPCTKGFVEAATVDDAPG